MPRAGLAPAVVAAAAADLADEVSPEPVSMRALADRLGVKAPSLYKHVDSLADLNRRVATIGAIELGDALLEATQGIAGPEALTTAARTVRTYVQQHPGRYAATIGATPLTDDDPLARAMEHTLRAFAAVLEGYRITPSRRIHALRTLRSAFHGFATLEASGGFQMQPAPEESLAWMVSLLDHGLRALRDDAQSPSSGAE